MGEGSGEGNGILQGTDEMKIVINKCYGGFSLSHEATMAYGKALGLNLKAYSSRYEGKKVTYVPYDEKQPVGFSIHYSTADLNKDGTLPNYFSTRNIPRNDPKLVEIVEKMGERANGSYAELKIVKIPDDVEWEIDESNGRESIHEVHRSWY